MEPLCWFLHKRETFVAVVVCYEGIRVITVIFAFQFRRVPEIWLVTISTAMVIAVTKFLIQV